MTAFKTWFTVACLGTMIAFPGCSSDSDSTAPGTQTSTASEPSLELKALVVTDEAPAQVVGVAQARESVSDGETIALEGRLKDFVSGKAAFTVVDGRIKSCIEMSDGCETPWDYCCIPQDVMASNTATVTLVDEDGKILNGNLQGVNSIDNLSTVVVTGKVQKDSAGNMTVAADKVYLR